MPTDIDEGLPLVSLHGGHTTAGDGSTNVKAMVEAACRRGMDVYGLSEHFYRPPEPRFRYPDERDSSWNGRRGWPEFAKDVQAAKAAHEAPGKPRIYLGAEVEYLLGYQSWTHAEVEAWPLDYVVISVHFIEVDGEFIPFDYSSDEWRRAARLCGGVPALYRRYYRHVLDALEWEIGDIVGHLDVIKIHAEHQVTDPEVEELVEEILARCAALDIRLDLNARGLIKPCEELYPSQEILERACSKGVGIVTGDDSHAPDDVGLNIEQALRTAMDAGYRKLELPKCLGGESFALKMA